MLRFLVLVLLALTCSGCLVSTSVGTFDCSWDLKLNGLRCEVVQVAKLP